MTTKSIRLPLAIQYRQFASPVTGCSVQVRRMADTQVYGTITSDVRKTDKDYSLKRKSSLGRQPP